MKKFIIKIIIILTSIMMVTGCAMSDSNAKSNEAKEEDSTDESIEIIPDYKNSRYKEIYLAGGCFWGIQAYIDKIYGVEYTNVGYANGKSEEADYYSIKETGHSETVYTVYDPEIITLQELLGYYYGIIDPTSLNKQGGDTGTQYRSGIYYVDEEDRKTIESSTEDEQTKYSKKIVKTIILWR